MKRKLIAYGPVSKQRLEMTADWGTADSISQLKALRQQLGFDRVLAEVKAIIEADYLWGKLSSRFAVPKWHRKHLFKIKSPTLCFY